LFDLLGGKEAPTPSQSRTRAVAVAVDGTPRKQVAANAGTADDAKIPGPTPRSTSKHTHIHLTTPSHRRTPGGKVRTPRSGGTGSVSKLQFATPAFLRRTALPMPTLDENAVSPAAVTRLPRKPLFRGLSSVVAGLRKLEEKTLDDDLDVLREMENERRPAPIAKPRTAQQKDAAAAGDQSLPVTEDSEASAAQVVELEDSQVPKQDHDIQPPGLLGGFDDETAYDSPEEQQLDRGQPLKVYQKRKPKRAHRLVSLRPTKAKRPTIEAEQKDEDVVPETQYDATKFVTLDDGALDMVASGSDNDDDFELGAANEEEGENPRKTSKKKDQKSRGTSEQQTKDGNGPVQRAVRMVKATANANFRRLKLKKKQGGKGRFGGRFGRRR
jgi:DNA replication regulator SLD2